MKQLHRAALTRAYRTLAQGLGGSATATALAALVAAVVGGGAEAVETALVAASASLATTLFAAFTSFWQGVAHGLPEVSDVTDE